MERLEVLEKLMELERAKRQLLNYKNNIIVAGKKKYVDEVYMTPVVEERTLDYHIERYHQQKGDKPFVIPIEYAEKVIDDLIKFANDNISKLENNLIDDRINPFE